VICQHLLYSKEELIGKDNRYYQTKENAKKAFQKFTEVYVTGNPIKALEMEVIRKDGTIQISEVSISLIKDAEGKPIAFRGTSRDITGRKRMEEQLRQREEQYRNILENMQEGYFEVDLAGNFTFFNDAICRLYGYSKEELKGTSHSQYTDKESSKKLFHAFNQVYKTGEPIKEFNWQVIGKDGAKRYVEASASLQKDSSGKPIGFKGVVHDITERKQAEQRLQESEKYFKEITENSSDIIIITDKKGNIKYCSRSIERFTGYKPEELIGRNGLKLIHPDDVKRAASNYSKAIVAIDAAVTNEFRIVRKDGSERYFSGLGRNLLDNPAVAGFIINARDVTESKLVNAELQRTLDNLRKSFGTTIQVMVSAVEMRDPYTAGHQLRVADIARSIAQEMGLSQDQVDGIRLAGSIHDIGKLSIPAEILSKPTKLTDIEFSLIKEHSRIGYEMLKDMESPWPLAQIVYQHHERMNGSGYPRKLKGDEILIEARIMAVADVVEAMASHRPYRPGLGIEAALEEIEKNRGIFYDNVVADACLRLFQEKNYKLP
jgi:PAS domain S-box-containing protein/putative nucleotidyltransferase with HDIG domain